MHCFSSRVTSWLTRTLRVGGFVLRRRIGASVIRPLHLGWPTQQQRRAQEAVAVLGSQTIPWDRHRQIERKFCTIVGGVEPPPVLDTGDGEARSNLTAHAATEPGSPLSNAAGAHHSRSLTLTSAVDSRR